MSLSEAKQELEVEVGKSLLKFQKETGLRVMGMTTEGVDVNTKVDGNSIIKVKFDIRLF